MNDYLDIPLWAHVLAAIVALVSGVFSSIIAARILVRQDIRKKDRECIER